MIVVSEPNSDVVVHFLASANFVDVVFLAPSIVSHAAATELDVSSLAAANVFRVVAPSLYYCFQLNAPKI